MTNFDEQACKEAEEEELYDTFTKLWADPEVSDVEFAFQAQAEAVLSDRGSCFPALNGGAMKVQIPAFTGISKCRHQI